MEYFVRSGFSLVHCHAVSGSSKQKQDTRELWGEHVIGRSHVTHPKHSKTLNKWRKKLDDLFWDRFLQELDVF
jgi:hypothetical protein